MQYMLMIFTDASKWAGLSEDQSASILKDFGAFIEAIVKSGHMRGGARLHPATTATTVRADRGETIVTDGPFPETKEHLGGYVLVECKDLDEALAIARRIPSIRAGDVIEVRPILSAPKT